MQIKLVNMMVGWTTSLKLTNTMASTSTRTILSLAGSGHREHTSSTSWEISMAGIEKVTHLIN
uniref:Uncharacterized protein n=1 Tax=Timema douglasi TaxID=61478 RepID=A0A7R8VWK6_TIMDO|nr:unnamed protein product [Timema douglasi]